MALLGRRSVGAGGAGKLTRLVSRRASGGIVSPRPPSASPSVPWRLMQPVVDLEEENEFLALVHASTVESRASSAQLLLEKKRTAFLSKV